MGNIQSCRKYRPRNGNNYGDIELQSMTNPISIYPMEGEAVASMQGQEVEPMEGEAVVSIQKGAVEQTQEDQQQGQAAQASSSQPIWLPDAAHNSKLNDDHLKKCTYFWEDLSKDGAEQRLVNKPDGTFILRMSEDSDELRLSFRNDARTYHASIMYDTTRLGGCFWLMRTCQYDPTNEENLIKGGPSILDFIEMMMQFCRMNHGGGYLIKPSPTDPPVSLTLIYPMLPNDPIYSDPDPYCFEENPANEENARTNLHRDLYRIQVSGFYWGFLTGQEAEEVLKDQPNGGYLLHDENEDQEGYDRFILSFKQSNRIYHLLVFYETGHWWLMIRPYQNVNCKIDGGPRFLDFIMRILTHKERYEMQPDAAEPPAFIDIHIPIFHPHHTGPRCDFARPIPEYAIHLDTDQELPDRSVQPFAECPYFWDVTRLEARSILHQEADGTFLLHPFPTWHESECMISFRVQNHTHHAMIKKTDDGFGVKFMTPSWRCASALVFVDGIMKDCLQSNARFSVETILGEMQTMRLIYPLYSTLHRGLQRRLEERRKMFPSASEEAIAPSYPIAQKEANLRMNLEKLKKCKYYWGECMYTDVYRMLDGKENHTFLVWHSKRDANGEFFNLSFKDKSGVITVDIVYSNEGFMFDRMVVYFRFKQASVVDLIQAVRARKHVPLQVHSPVSWRSVLLDIRYPVMWDNVQTKHPRSLIVLPRGPLKEEDIVERDSTVY